MEESNEENPPPNLPKIKIFQKIQKNLYKIGIDSNSATQLNPFNAKNLMGLLSLGLGIIGSIMYIIIEAKTFIEFTESIFECTAFIQIILNLMIMIFYLSELFKAINNCECLANTSKSEKGQMLHYNPNPKKFNVFLFKIQALKYTASQLIFKETHQQVERLSGILFFVLVKMTIANLVLPPIMYSLFKYFTTDAGHDAFTLSFPMW